MICEANLMNFLILCEYLSFWLSLYNIIFVYTPDPVPFFIFSSAQLPKIINPSLAVVAFQSQRDVLLVAICSCLTTLANKLLAKSVISSEIFEKACHDRIVSRERAVYLLSCVQDRIKTEPADFVKVVDIVESEPTLTRQARQLVDSYRKCSVMLKHASNDKLSYFSQPTPHSISCPCC